ncbi:MAG: hypothetical protein ACSHWU_06895, partial [Marinicella sp.]
PWTVESLVFNPDFYVGNISSAILMGCFGAQAVLTGTVILASKFRPSTFLIFGVLGSIPFFVFNYYFYYINPVFSSWMVLDFLGNIIILVLCLLGYRLSKLELLN